MFYTAIGIIGIAICLFYLVGLMAVSLREPRWR